MINSLSISEDILNDFFAPEALPPFTTPLDPKQPLVEAPEMALLSRKTL
jgi:hypothetical protein